LSIWLKPISLETLHAVHSRTAAAHIGIQFSEVGDDYIVARVPVIPSNSQTYGLLHGGVSVLLAETLSTCGAHYASPEGWRALGIDINANHLKGVTGGWVHGVAWPAHRGRSTHVWQVDLRNDAGELVCISRVTVGMMAPRPLGGGAQPSMAASVFGLL
jgi:1,4-dihydroxy-2-naphthoyl-CoA hydrolase